MSRPFSIGSGLSAVFRDAGHIPGSATITVTHQAEERSLRIAYTGDYGNGLHPFLRQPQRIPEADVLLVESTYGGTSRAVGLKPYMPFQKAVADAVSRGHRVVIPAFVLDRTPEGPRVTGRRHSSGHDSSSARSGDEPNDRADYGTLSVVSCAFRTLQAVLRSVVFLGGPALRESLLRVEAPQARGTAPPSRRRGIVGRRPLRRQSRTHPSFGGGTRGRRLSPSATRRRPAQPASFVVLPMGLRATRSRSVVSASRYGRMCPMHGCSLRTRTTHSSWSWHGGSRTCQRCLSCMEASNRPAIWPRSSVRFVRASKSRYRTNGQVVEVSAKQVINEMRWLYWVSIR